MTGNTVHAQSHQVLGALCLLSLAPVQISVHMDVDLLGKPPKADILLLRREGEAWNAAQRARLPDGVRDSAAAHVLVEFKWTESVNETALAQAVSYDHFYQSGAEVVRGAGADRPAERADAAERPAGEVGVRGRAEGRLLQPTTTVATREVAGVEPPAGHSPTTPLSSSLPAGSGNGKRPLRRWICPW